VLYIYKMPTKLIIKTNDDMKYEPYQIFHDPLKNIINDNIDNDNIDKFDFLLNKLKDKIYEYELLLNDQVEDKKEYNLLNDKK